MLMSAELNGCVTWFIYFVDLLWIRYDCTKFHHCGICATDFMEGGPFCPPPPHPWAALKKPILNSVDKQGIRKFFYQQAILLSVYIWKLSMEVASYSTKSIAKITSVLVLFWLIQAIQQWCHSTNSPWWQLLYQPKHCKN